MGLAEGTGRLITEGTTEGRRSTVNRPRGVALVFHRPSKAESYPVSSKLASQVESMFTLIGGKKAMCRALGFELDLIETTWPTGGTQKGEYWGGPTNGRAAPAVVVSPLPPWMAVRQLSRKTRKAHTGRPGSFAASSS